MRCVLLSQLFHPEAVSTGMLLTELAVALQQRGVEVKAIAGQPSYYDFRRVPSRMELEGVQIVRPPCTSFRKDSISGRLLNMVTYIGGLLWHLVSRREKGPLLIVTTPPFLPLAGLIAHKLVGSRYIVLVHDVYPDVLPHFGLVKPDSLVVRVWNRLNRWVYGHAERVIVLGRKMAEILAEKDPRPDAASRIDVIPNWSDGELVVPKDKKESRFYQQLGLDADFVMLYSGNSGRLHNVEILIEAMEQLRPTDSHLLFVGGGQKRPKLESMAAESPLANVTFHPYQPLDQIGESLTACDVQVAVLDRDFTGLAVPCKLYGMLASGKALLVVCSREGEMGRVVEETGCGLVVEPGDLEGLVRAMEKLRTDPQLVADMGRRARKAFEDNYTLEHVVDQYIQCLRLVE